MMIVPVKGKYDHHGNAIDCGDSSNWISIAIGNQIGFQ